MTCHVNNVRSKFWLKLTALQSDYADDVGSHLYVYRLVTDLMLESWTWLVVNNLTVLSSVHLMYHK